MVSRLGAGRANILARTAAAVVGGYAASVLLSVCVANVFPMPKADSVLAAVLLSFVFYAAVVLWAFSARTLRRVWVGLILALVLLSFLSAVTGPLAES